jgi:hypothetical protein
MEQRIKLFVSLPIASLNATQLKSRLGEIGKSADEGV